MRIEGIELTNWLTHRHLMLALTPLTVITGPNRRGKSSIGDAIGFALTSDLSRGVSKGERKLLLSEGATSPKGTVKLVLGKDKVLERDIASGKLVQSVAIAQDTCCFDALPYLIKPSTFTSAPADERRSLLQEVLKAKPDKARVATELEKRGVRADVVKKLRQAHIGELDTWVEMADTEAKGARALWKATTGEVYGAVKAATWAAPIPERPTDEALEAALRAEQRALDAVESAQREIGAAGATSQAAQTLSVEIAQLREWTASLPELQAATAGIIKQENNVHDEHARARDALADLRRAALAECPCPHCGCMVTVDGAGKLHAASTVVSRPSTARLASAAALVTELADALEVASTARRTHEAKIVRLDAQRMRLKEMEARAAAAPAIDVSAEANLRAAKEVARQARDAVTVIETQINVAAAAQDKTTKAMRHHELVEQWTKVADLVAPGGIPGEILVDAMVPMTEALRGIATETAWPQVTIGADMAIAANGRPYDLLSESEQWRVNTSIAVALAGFSGLKMAVLDRFDVLDIPSRKPAMEWLFKKVKAGALETCLLIGTMKEPPAAPKAVNVVWLGDAPAQAKAA